MSDWYHGIVQMPWWGYILVTLVLTQITIAAVTLYLHRSQAHRALDMHPLIAHFFRFWLWLTTGMRTREWVAVHRKHHARCETEEDPHSPQVVGIQRVLWRGVGLYKIEAAKPDTLEKYGRGAPDDWIERHVYTPHLYAGLVIMALIDLLLFGLVGAVIYLIQIAWIPFWAAGVINGLGHWWGYRNYETTDASTNLSPWGIWIGGEELHNNHHAYPSSARFSLRAGEFDIGWFYIRVMRALGLARVLREAPKPVIDPTKRSLDLDTVKAVIVSRMHVMRNYAANVIMPVLKEELAQRDAAVRRRLKQARLSLIRDESRLDDGHRMRLQSALAVSHSLRQVVEYRRQLQALWATAASQERLLASLQEWCARAEASGIQSLRDFAVRLRGYSLSPA